MTTIGRPMTTVKEQRQRDIHLDLIRVIAMLFVISIHAQWDFEAPLFCSAFFKSLFFTANGLFFLISGRFALKFKEDELDPASSYRSFYWKKFCSLVIPLFFYSALIMVYYYYCDPNKHLSDITGFFKDLFWLILPSSTARYTWFIYSLIGFMLTAPFISIMFNKMSVTSLKLFFYIAVGFEIVSIILFDYLLRSPFPVHTWPFVGWYFYFLCGYIINRLDVFHQKKIVFIIIGLICLLITTGMVMYTEGLDGIHDNSPIYLFTCIGLYLLLESVPMIKPLGKAATFIADHSYAVYLIHVEVLVFIRSFLPASNPISWIACVLAVAIASIALAFPCDTFIIRPIVKKLTNASSRIKIAFTGLLLTVVLLFPVILILLDR